MATQTNVKFSRVSKPLDEALEALHDEVFEPLQIELRMLSRIAPTGDPEYPGYDAIGRPLKVRALREVLDEVGPQESFGLGYLVGVPAYVYLNFFEFSDESYAVLLTFDSSLLHYADDNNDPGDVLERILSNVVSALEVDVCGYNSTDRYAGEFDSLDIVEIVGGVRSGALLTAQPPFYYAIKVHHASPRELHAVSAGTPAKYKRFRTHHVLSAWPPETGSGPGDHGQRVRST